MGLPRGTPARCRDRQGGRRRIDHLLRRLLAPSLVVLGLLGQGPLQARPVDRRFERLGVEQGLSQASVTAVAQSPRGFLWIGTDEGLNRYDGYDMVVFRRGAHGLGSSRISALLVTSRGQLWVGTRGGGISLYDPRSQRFATFRHDPEDPGSLAHDDVMALAEDGAGRLWIATARGGLSRLDDPTSGVPRFTRFRHDESDVTSLSDDRARALLVDRLGQLWVGTMSGVDRLLEGEGAGFAHYRHDPGVESSLLDDEAWALLEDSDGVLWVGTWGGGLSRLDDVRATPEDARFEVFLSDPSNPFSLSGDRVMELFEDSRGTIWVGTLSGLNELLPEERRSPRPRFLRHRSDPAWRYSLAGDAIRDLFEDNRGDLWIGTDGGLSRIDRSVERFESYRFGPGTEAGIAGAPHGVLLDEDGVLWVAHHHGLDRIQPSADRFDSPRVTRFGALGDQPFPAREALGILEDRFGYLWFTSYNGLIGLPPTERGKLRPRFVHVPREALSSNAVLSLHEDAFGTLWIGTYRALHRVVRDESGMPVAFPSYAHDPSDENTLSSRSVSAIASSADGTIWVGTYSGLNRLEPVSGRVTRYLPDGHRDDSLGHENITTILVDRRDRVWVGTRGGGLNRWLRGDEFDVLGVDEGLPSDNVRALREGRDGTIWFASSRGVVRFDPMSGEVSVLGASHGLPGGEASILEETHDGRLIVATHDALTVFDPQQLRPSDFAPPIVLTGLRILNRPVSIGTDSILPHALGYADRIDLRHSDYLVGFEFAALSFRRADAVAYRYRLEGLDEDWIETDAGDRRATYSTLRPGSYRFRVQASVDGGPFTDGAAIAINVLPPWWFTWWARLGAGAIVVLVAASWPLLRLRHARLQNLRLEMRVEERTRELAEANLKLEAASRTDTLTGLPNRRHFLVRAEEEVATFRRSGRVFSLALADIDDFKAINDTLGHECGDAVLCHVAEILRSSLREVDLVSRWGGEEFLFLFPDTGVSGAATVADKVRAEVARRPLPWHGREVGVTLTVGVAQVAPGGSLDACGAAADEALYRGKRSGKNRVVAAGGTVVRSHKPRAVS